MESGIVRDGCRDILRFMDSKDLTRLLSTVTNGQIRADTDKEAIDAIVNFEQSPSGFLRRQKVTRQHIFQYLVRQNQRPNPKADKDTLLNCVLDLWESRGATVRPSTTLQVDHLDSNRPAAASLKALREAPRVPEEHTQPAAAAEVPVVRHQQPDLSPTVIDTLPQEPPQLVEQLGVQFSRWFYELLNQQLHGLSPEWGEQHFYPACWLAVTCKLPQVLTEKYEGAALVVKRLEAFVTEEHILFNPNLDFGGVKSWGESHGLVVVQACGTLHQGPQVLGLFEQKFGLVRDPLMENNWRIKFTDLRLAQEQVQRPPTLEETQTRLAISL